MWHKTIIQQALRVSQQTQHQPLSPCMSTGTVSPVQSTKPPGVDMHKLSMHSGAASNKLTSPSTPQPQGRCGCTCATSSTHAICSTSVSCCKAVNLQRCWLWQPQGTHNFCLLIKKASKQLHCMLSHMSPHLVQPSRHGQLRTTATVPGTFKQVGPKDPAHHLHTTQNTHRHVLYNKQNMLCLGPTTPLWVMHSNPFVLR